MTDPALRARQLLTLAVEELGLTATAEQIQSLLELSELLFGWSKRINLTGHRSVDDIVGRLVVDAISLAAQLPATTSLADIGSGAGFPGLPIAILRPQTQVFLIESRERRHHFQRAALRSLGLENVEALLGRAEDLEPSGCTAAIAQAVAPRDAFPLLLRWSTPGGLLLFPGSDAAPEPPVDHRATLEACVRYRVACGGPERTLWIARKSDP